MVNISNQRGQHLLYNAGISALAGPILTNYIANLYSNKISMDYYDYQKRGYERQLADWHKNVPNRTIRYPELSYEGKIRGANLGISQNIANMYRDTARTEQSLGFTVAGGYRSSRSLYGKSVGRSSRYL